MDSKYEDLTFGNIMKKVELSARNGQTAEMMKWMTVMQEEAERDDEHERLKQLLDIIMTSDDPHEELEEFFENDAY